MGCTFHRYSQPGGKIPFVGFVWVAFLTLMNGSGDGMTIAEERRLSLSLISLFYCQRSEPVIPRCFILLRRSDIWALFSGNGAKKGRKDAKKRPPGHKECFRLHSVCSAVFPWLAHVDGVNEGGEQDISNQFTHAFCLIIKLHNPGFSKMRHAFDECLSAESDLKRLRGFSHLLYATNQLFPARGNLICFPTATHR